MRYIFILLALLCASCGTALPTIKPYKLDVQQGNVVTSKMLLQLRPGMTKSQVRFIMGTPLIQDSFHGNRWDYVYQMREDGKIKEQRRVILDFENEQLKSVRGDVIPAGSDQAKSDDAQTPTGPRVVAPVKKTEEKGILNKLKFWEKDEAELAKEAAEKEAAAKAKRDAEEAARNAVSVQPPKEEPVTEEPKSLLAVPIELPVANDAPAPAPADTVRQEAAPAVVEVLPSEPQSSKVDSIAKPDSPAAPAMIELQPSEPVKPVSVEQPAAPDDAQRYQPSSGMVFDRKLQLGAEEPESVAEPVSAAPRAGNKEVPKPKELPQESDPSFFDRMLEQIGF